MDEVKMTWTKMQHCMQTFDPLATTLTYIPHFLVFDILKIWIDACDTRQNNILIPTIILES